ncbi:hypothetical protein HYE67_003168 [Fusarium culmorum]|uniref:Uncharacterized protein n=1 Tax=Fusarium culmorum TaxID=5516 RepID=A0A7S8D2S2_FUSCU|nr:hypothetical protein HYE67_003168 [Fusarium culmorum]
MADPARAELDPGLIRELQAVRASIKNGTSTLSAKLDIATKAFHDEEIRQRDSRECVTNSNDSVAGLVDHLSTAVHNENNGLVAGGTGYDNVAGLPNTFDTAKNKMANIFISTAKLDGIANAAGVCHIDILAKAINRIETSCGKLEKLPDAFSKLEVIAVNSWKLDGISKAIDRANDKLVEIETSSGDTAELAKISEAHQKKLAESVVKIDGRLVTKLTETQLAVRMGPLDAKINATKQILDTLPSKADLASEISRQLATQAWIDEARGRSNGLGEREQRHNAMDHHRQNDMNEVTTRLNNHLDSAEVGDNQSRRQDAPVIRLEEIQAHIVRQLQGLQTSLDRNEQKLVDCTERLRGTETS